MIVFRIESKPSRQGEVSGGGDLLGVFFSGRLAGEDVAGDLFVEELVVWDVVVKGVDHVVAVAPRLGQRVIGGITGCIGVADDIEPVPAPVFAVMWGSEQAVNHFRKGVG